MSFRLEDTEHERERHGLDQLQADRENADPLDALVNVLASVLWPDLDTSCPGDHAVVLSKATISGRAHSAARRAIKRGVSRLSLSPSGVRAGT